MRTVVKGLFLSAVLVALTGCGINGKWTLQSVTPETAKAHCPIQAICLMEDGTYQSCAMMGDKCTMEKGTYTFDQGAKTLIFKTSDGKEIKYTAELTACGGELKVTGTDKGKEWTATMKRGECPKGCCKGDQKACCTGDKKTCDPKACNKPCPKKADAKAEPKGEPKAEHKAAEPVAKTEPTKASTGKTEAKQTEKTNK